MVFSQIIPASNQSLQETTNTLRYTAKADISRANDESDIPKVRRAGALRIANPYSAGAV